MPAWGRMARAALIAASKEAIDNLDPSMVSIKPINDYYKRLYLTVIPPIADKQYSKFKKDISTPIDPDERNPIWDDIIIRFLATGDMATRITRVTENTKEILRRVLIQAQSEGLSNQQTARRLRESYAMSYKRGLVIARTELGTAEMTGEFVGMRRLSMEGYQVTKTWKTSGDSKVRDDHVQMEGITLPLNQDFDVNGWPMSRPLDPKGGASQVINCRCFLTYGLSQ